MNHLQLIKELNEIKDNNYSGISKLKSLVELEELMDIDVHSYLMNNDIMCTEIIEENEALRVEAEGFCIARMSHMLNGIAWFNDEYYEYNGYGNLINVRAISIECIIEEIIETLKEIN